VDSPGGDGLASDLVSEALRICSQKKPVIISQGSLAASGGYWLSMYGDTIIAGPNTITGSIGVIGGWIWDAGIGGKMGLTSDYVKAGKHAELGFGINLPLINIQIPKRNLTLEERMMMEEIIRTMYKEFVAKVAVGRNMDYKKVKDLAQGRVWSGTDGKENGLVDLIGGLETAIAVAKETAGISGNQRIRLIELPKRGLFNPEILLPILTGMKVQKKETDYFMEYIRMIAENPGHPLPILPPDWIF
jgi:protease-4